MPASDNPICTCYIVQLHTDFTKLIAKFVALTKVSP